MSEPLLVADPLEQLRSERPNVLEFSPVEHIKRVFLYPHRADRNILIWDVNQEYSILGCMKRNRFSDGEETLRKLLRKCRVEAGLRQEDLAEKLNVHQSFVSKYESGERLLTFVETINICRALGLDLNTLLEEYLPHHDT